VEVFCRRKCAGKFQWEKGEFFWAQVSTRGGFADKQYFSARLKFPGEGLSTTRLSGHIEHNCQLVQDICFVVFMNWP